MDAHDPVKCIDNAGKVRTATGCDRSVIGANGQNPGDGKRTSRSLVTTATGAVTG